MGASMTKKDRAMQNYIIKKITNYIASANLVPIGVQSPAASVGITMESRHYLDEDNGDIACAIVTPPNPGLERLPTYHIQCGSLILSVFAGGSRTEQLIMRYNYTDDAEPGVMIRASPITDGFDIILALLPSAILGGGPHAFGLGRGHIVFHSANLRDAAIILPRDIIDTHGRGNLF